MSVLKGTKIPKMKLPSLLFKRQLTLIIVSDKSFGCKTNTGRPGGGRPVRPLKAW
jgi:hypothetical protein